MSSWSNIHLWTEYDWIGRFTLKELQKKCIEYGVSSEGADYELAERIIEVFKYQKYSNPIEKFSGDYQDVEKWLLDFDKRADYWEWTEIERVLVLRGNLVGTAGLLLSLMTGEERICYDKLRLALLKEFCVEPGSSALKILIEKKEQLKLNRQLLIKERCDLIQDLETKAAKRQQCVFEEEVIRTQEDEYESHPGPMQELQPEPEEDDVKKKNERAEVEEENSTKKESESMATEKFVEKDVHRVEEDIQLQEEAENVDVADVHKKAVHLETEVQQQNAEKDQIVEDNEPQEKIIEKSVAVIRIEAGRQLEENHEEPEDEEDDKMSDTKKMNEMKLIIEKYRDKKRKIQSLDKFEAGVAFVLSYVDTGWTDILIVEVVRVVCYVDTGWMDVSGPVQYAHTGWRKFEEYNTNELIEDDQRSGWPSC